MPESFKIIAENTGLAIFRIGLVVAMLLAHSAVWPQQATTRPVTIQVSDQSGAPIARAQVRLSPAPYLEDPETDEHGNLTLNLKPGNYAVMVSERGFKSWSENMYVTKPDGEANASQLYPVVLQVGTYSGPDVIPYPKDSLVLIAGAYHAPVVLSPADFRALPHITITVLNGQTKAKQTFSGVPLAILLARVNAPLGKEFHHEALTSYLVASGSDGYSVVLSLAEADPGLRGGQILVADALDGKPLGYSGPYQLVVPEDKLPTRWIRKLDSISLQGLR